MNECDLAVVQGMLDARAETDEQTAVCPYSIDSEGDLYGAWWTGYEFHRDPKLVAT